MSAGVAANYDIAPTGDADALSGMAMFGDVGTTLYADRQGIAGKLSSQQNIWTAPIKADRNITLDGTRAPTGDVFRIVRSRAATGNIDLNIASARPKALAPAQWCDVAFDGRSWTPTAAGQP